MLVALISTGMRGSFFSFFRVVPGRQIDRSSTASSTKDHGAVLFLQSPGIQSANQNGVNVENRNPKQIPNRVSSVPLVPRLRLGTRCLAGSASSGLLSARQW